MPVGRVLALLLAARPIAGGAPQMDRMHHREERQPRIGVSEDQRTGTRERVVQGVGLGQARHIGDRVLSGKAL